MVFSLLSKLCNRYHYVTPGLFYDPENVQKELACTWQGPDHLSRLMPHNCVHAAVLSQGLDHLTIHLDILLDTWPLWFWIFSGVQWVCANLEQSHTLFWEVTILLRNSFCSGWEWISMRYQMNLVMKMRHPTWTSGSLTIPPSNGWDWAHAGPRGTSKL